MSAEIKTLATLIGIVIESVSAPIEGESSTRNLVFCFAGSVRGLC